MCYTLSREICVGRPVHLRQQPYTTYPITSPPTQKTSHHQSSPRYLGISQGLYQFATKRADTTDDHGDAADTRSIVRGRRFRRVQEWHERQGQGQGQGQGREEEVEEENDCRHEQQRPIEWQQQSERRRQRKWRRQGSATTTAIHDFIEWCQSRFQVCSRRRRRRRRRQRQRRRMRQRP